MWSRVPRSVLAALSATALVAVLAACGDDDPGDAGPSTPSSGATSDATSDPSTSPSSPTVEPATGELLEVPSLSLHLLEGRPWKPSAMGTLVVTGSYLTDEGYSVTVRLSDLVSSGTTTESDAKAFIASSRNDPRPRRAENREINGVEAWTARAQDADYDLFWTGGVHAGRAWGIEIQTPRRLADADELRERVLASVVWKG